jgi:hypothetical protein
MYLIEANDVRGSELDLLLLLLSMASTNELRTL